MIFLFQGVIFRFHVNFRAVFGSYGAQNFRPSEDSGCHKSGMRQVIVFVGRYSTEIVSKLILKL